MGKIKRKQYLVIKNYHPIITTNSGKKPTEYAVLLKGDVLTQKKGEPNVFSSKNKRGFALYEYTIKGYSEVFELIKKKKDISGYKKPIAIEDGEWWYMGYTVTRQIHPLLKKYIVRSDKNWLVNTFNNLKECYKHCKENPIFNPVYKPIDYLR